MPDAPVIVLPELHSTVEIARDQQLGNVVLCGIAYRPARTWRLVAGTKVRALGPPAAGIILEIEPPNGFKVPPIPMDRLARRQESAGL